MLEVIATWKTDDGRMHFLHWNDQAELKIGVLRRNVLYMCIPPSCKHCGIGSILNPLAGKFSEETRKKGKGVKARKQGHLTIGGALFVAVWLAKG